MVNNGYHETFVLKEIDSKGTFEADDEIGVVFTAIKEAVDELNEITEQEL